MLGTESISLHRCAVEGSETLDEYTRRVKETPSVTYKLPVLITHHSRASSWKFHAVLSLGRAQMYASGILAALAVSYAAAGNNFRDE